MNKKIKIDVKIGSLSEERIKELSEEGIEENNKYEISATVAIEGMTDYFEKIKLDFVLPEFFIDRPNQHGRLVTDKHEPCRVDSFHEYISNVPLHQKNNRKTLGARFIGNEWKGYISVYNPIVAYIAYDEKYRENAFSGIKEKLKGRILTRFQEWGWLGLAAI